MTFLQFEKQPSRTALDANVGVDNFATFTLATNPRELGARQSQAELRTIDDPILPEGRMVFPLAGDTGGTIVDALVDEESLLRRLEPFPFPENQSDEEIGVFSDLTITLVNNDDEAVTFDDQSADGSGGFIVITGDTRATNMVSVLEQPAAATLQTGADTTFTLRYQPSIDSLPILPFAVFKTTDREPVLIPLTAGTERVVAVTGNAIEITNLLIDPVLTKPRVENGTDFGVLDPSTGEVVEQTFVIEIPAQAILIYALSSMTLAAMALTSVSLTRRRCQLVLAPTPPATFRVTFAPTRGGDDHDAQIRIVSNQITSLLFASQSPVSVAMLTFSSLAPVCRQPGRRNSTD